MSVQKKPDITVKKVSSTSGISKATTESAAVKSISKNPTDKLANKTAAKSGPSSALKKTGAKKTVALKDDAPKRKKTSGTGARS